MSMVCSVHTENDLLSLPQILQESGVDISLDAEEIVTTLETMKKMILNEWNKGSEVSATLFLNMNSDMLKFETSLIINNFMNY